MYIAKRNFLTFPDLLRDDVCKNITPISAVSFFLLLSVLVKVVVVFVLSRVSEWTWGWDW
jgi:hypothetical protein